MGSCAPTAMPCCALHVVAIFTTIDIEYHVLMSIEYMSSILISIVTQGSEITCNFEFIDLRICAQLLRTSKSIRKSNGPTTKNTLLPSSVKVPHL